MIRPRRVLDTEPCKGRLKVPNQRICSIDGCGKRFYGRGWCKHHYDMWKLHGDPLITKKRTKSVCSVDGCNKFVKSNKLCSKHLSRMLRRGTLEISRNAPGEMQRYIQDVAIPFDEDVCLIWPYPLGHSHYPTLTRGRGRIYVTHIVCEARWGTKPSPAHQVAHKCGNTKCCAPRHLRWATPEENNDDKYVHGTLKVGEAVPGAKLSNADVRHIRKLLPTMADPEIAKLYLVKPATINAIRHRKNWAKIV